MPNLRFERNAGAPLAAVAGIDEAGRGPLAGPVYAAAVILPPRGLPRRIARRIDDSKALSAETRRELAPMIQESCQVGVGVATVEEIDAVNILQATFLAMCRAVAALPTPPEVALVDGNLVPPALACPAQAVIEGDRKSLSIAAASIVAKVLRDQVMAALAEECPGYGWERNAGYATAEHRHALIRLGPTRHHRRSFSPVYQQLSLTL